ncbi:hypothetical protein ACBI99_41460 [Nonomuraea sp. ATR24]|uniref:hypothetical protein n=1 Tax=Nonomuraea sp. ATR24 TaxID=1676744 RepID=UPI0035C010D6
MTLLEERYRLALRMLPASYRAEREEEMVEAFLEGARHAHGERGTQPDWGEVVSIAALAIRIRVGGIGAAPRSRAVGDAVRLAALLGLGYQAVIGWIGLAFSVQVLGPLPGQSPVLTPRGAAPELVSAAESLVWIAAFAALALGRVRAAKLLAGLGLLYVLVMFGVDAFTWPRSLVDSAPHLLVTVVPVAALLTAYHRDAPVRRSPPLSALPLGLTVAYAAAVLAVTGLGGGTDAAAAWAAGWLDPQGVATAALLVAGLVSLLRGTAPAGRLALAVVTVPLMAARSPHFLIDVAPAQPLTITLTAQSAALLLLCLALIVSAVRALPRPHAAALPGLPRTR